MTIAKAKISPCLWFDTQAEDAAEFYCSVFDNSKITAVSRYGEEGFDKHGKPAGSVMAVAFELDGQSFTALNGGPHFTFNEAVSFQVQCKDQGEVDYFWDRLTADGGSEGPCGWLKDRFGLSWQVVPAVLQEMMAGKDSAAAQRVTKAFLQMKKFDIAALKRAFEGTAT